MIRAVEFLVSRGHREHDVIYEYSFPKIMEYYKAGVSNQKIEFYHQAVSVRYAQHAEGEDFGKYAESLLPKIDIPEQPIDRKIIAELMAVK
jgi:hypothetical protein